MKNGAVLLNFARDTIVNDKALLNALESGKLRNYVTDFPNDAVSGKMNVVALPHLGASTSEAEDNCAVMAAEELMEFIEKGNIKNSVNFPYCNLGALNKEASARVCILNKNVPSMLSKITNAMADLDINIRDLTNKSRGDYAVTLMDIDEDISEEDLTKAFDFEGIIRVRIIR